MGLGLFDSFPDFVEKACEILGYSLKKMCLHDPEKKLNQTLYTQLALYVVNSLNYLTLINQNIHFINQYCSCQLYDNI
jgi:trans-AT polyketide synthase/acyltransferase/oxidoreductase domain-containing protein